MIEGARPRQVSIYVHFMLANAYDNTNMLSQAQYYRRMITLLLPLLVMLPQVRSHYQFPHVWKRTVTIFILLTIHHATTTHGMMLSLLTGQEVYGLERRIRP
jgi:hypothetical protein